MCEISGKRLQYDFRISCKTAIWENKTNASEDIQIRHYNPKMQNYCKLRARVCCVHRAKCVGRFSNLRAIASRVPSPAPARSRCSLRDSPLVATVVPCVLHGVRVEESVGAGVERHSFCPHMIGTRASEVMTTS
jgi:hypothetical protein